MAYLIAHMAISLVFADLLGLLLGWLIWGYAARQRGQEVMVLRERLADVQISAARQMSAASEARLAFPNVFQPVPPVEQSPAFFDRLGTDRLGIDPVGLSHLAAQSEVVQSEVVQSEVAQSAAADTIKHNSATTSEFADAALPERSGHRPFFEDGDDELGPPIPVVGPVSVPAPAPVALPLAPDLEAEVKEARIQHLQRQVRELEGVRDRVQPLQADLADAIASRKAAEVKFQEAKNDFEVRSSSLLSQVRDFESAAAEWDRIRHSLEREKIDYEKELVNVKATLRDLQNSQRPQAVDAPPTASAIELNDLRERYQRALRERDAIAAELEFWKQVDGSPRPNDAAHQAELEESIRIRDTQLTEQAARVESLLWRVAELEPFAAEAPKREEELRSRESEIAGHIAMHSENGERIRSLQNHIAELRSTTVPSEELQRIISEQQSEHQTELQAAAQEHEKRAADLHKSVQMKDDEIAEHVSARYGQVTLMNNMQAQIDHLETLVRRMQTMERQLVDRETEIRGLLAAHSEIQRDMETWKAHATELEPIAAKVPTLEAALTEHTTELQRLRESLNDKEGQLAFLQERLSVLSSRDAAHRQHVQQLEPLAARTPVLEQKLAETEQHAKATIQTLQERHQGELTRLKVNSAQRIKKFRQSINGFKA